MIGISRWIGRDSSSLTRTSQAAREGAAGHRYGTPWGSLPNVSRPTAPTSSAEMLDWLASQRAIEPCIPVSEKLGPCRRDIRARRLRLRSTTRQLLLLSRQEANRDRCQSTAAPANFSPVILRRVPNRKAPRSIQENCPRSGPRYRQLDANSHRGGDRIGMLLAGLKRRCFQSPQR